VTHPETNQTALHFVTSPDHVKSLLKNHSHVNAQENLRQNTPLHVAASTNITEVVEALLCGGADTEAENKDGETPLFVAIKADASDVVDVLLKHGASLNKIDKLGRTVLHVAIESSSIPLIEKLVLLKVPILEKDINGQTVFDYLDSLSISNRKAHLYALFSSLNSNVPLEQLVTTFTKIISE